MKWLQTEGGEFLNSNTVTKIYTKLFSDNTWRLCAEVGDNIYVVSISENESVAWDRLIDLINTLDGTSCD